jgi:hypothetical protein
LPHSAIAAGGLVLVLAALMWATPQVASPWEPGRESGTAEPGESADLQLLLKDAPHDAAVE